MLALHTLGDLRVEGDSQARLSSRRKELTLLTYLARRAPRPIGRGELADLLWGERDTARSRQSLRQALLELKRMLGDGLESGGERISLAAGAVCLDAAEFESDLAAGHWQAALAHWGGEFLTGSDDVGGDDFRVWLEAEREGLRRGLRLALSRLIEETRHNRAWSDGLAWAQRWVELLPFDEEAHRQRVELLHLGGRTVEALARHAEFRSQLRAIEVEPSSAFIELGGRLEREAAAGDRRTSPGSAALFTPDLVGRGPALAELLAAWQRVRTGRAASVLVEGEAGIGKTRLCEEFLGLLVDERAQPLVVRARGHEPVETAPFGLTREIVTALASAAGLGGASPAALAELSVVAPVVRGRFPALPQASGGQVALEDALTEAVAVVSDERPVVLFIDDLSRCDEASLRLLRSIVARVSRGVFVLMAARTGDDEPSAAYIELASESQVRRLKLQLLGPREVETLLGSMLELPPAERHRLAQRLHAQGGGNPFYTIELTAAMVDEELLTPTEAGAWRLAATTSDNFVPLPATLREVVSRRLQRLTPEVRGTLEAAAVLGRTFDADLLPEVSGDSPTTSAVTLEELITRRMVRQAAESPGMYEFAHEIVGRITYDLLSPKRREALHRAAADAWQARVRRSSTARSARDYHRARARSRSPAARWRRRALAGLGGAGLLAVSGVWLMPASLRATLFTLLTRDTPALVSHRIVVTPLTNHTNDSSLAGLGALAADWIAQGLMRTTRFEVVDPRTTSVTGRVVSRIPALLRDRNPAIAIAHETGSGTVLSGDLFREGDSLRVLMRVIDARTGNIVRVVDPVSGSVRDPSQLVSALRERVLAAVASAVDTTSRGFSAALAVPPSYEAYTEVSKAWESFFRADLSDVFQRLTRATELDSQYMTPLLMRAYVETRLGHWAAVDTLVQRLKSHRAILTPAERVVLAGLQADLRGDLWDRLRQARELVYLTPASVEGYTLAASSALFVNHPREALSILSRVDPDRGLLLVAPYFWINQSPALHRLGNHRAELASARQGLRRFPDRSATHFDLLVALAALGDVEALRRELPRLSRDDSEPTLAQRQKALWVWRELRAHGHQAAAAQWLAGLLAQPRIAEPDTSRVGALLEGDIQSAAGHWEEASQFYAAGLLHHPRDPALLGRLGVTAAHQGYPADAHRLDQSLAALKTPHLFGSHTYARARIAAALGDHVAAVNFLRTAWVQGRPLAFDDRTNEDVHTDEVFDPLRDFFPFQMLMRTD